MKGVGKIKKIEIFDFCSQHSFRANKNKCPFFYIQCKRMRVCGGIGCLNYLKTVNAMPPYRSKTG